MTIDPLVVGTADFVDAVGRAGRVAAKPTVNGGIWHCVQISNQGSELLVKAMDEMVKLRCSMQLLVEPSLNVLFGISPRVVATWLAGLEPQEGDRLAMSFDEEHNEVSFVAGSSQATFPTIPADKLATITEWLPVQMAEVHDFSGFINEVSWATDRKIFNARSAIQISPSRIVATDTYALAAVEHDCPVDGNVLVLPGTLRTALQGHKGETFWFGVEGGRVLVAPRPEIQYTLTTMAGEFPPAERLLDKPLEDYESTLVNTDEACAVLDRLAGLLSNDPHEIGADFEVCAGEIEARVDVKGTGRVVEVIHYEQTPEQEEEENHTEHRAQVDLLRSAMRGSRSKQVTIHWPRTSMAGGAHAGRPIWITAGNYRALVAPMRRTS